MQPTSKATRHQSVGTPSRRMRRVHKDPQAHQSFQTALRQAMPHIYEMKARLAVSRSSLGPNVHIFWSVDQHVRPTIGRFVLGSTFHVSTPHSMPSSVPGGRGPISRLKRPWHPPIYTRGGGKNQDIHQVLNFKPPLVFRVV
jgi:hypothetical protein